MNVLLKRKCSEETSISKIRFLANLQNLEETPLEKGKRNKLAKKQSCVPEDIFMNYFEKNEMRSSGLLLKNKAKKIRRARRVENEVVNFLSLVMFFRN